MAHQVNLSAPPKNSARLSVMFSFPKKQGWDYIIYHCQLYHAPQKVKDLHLLAVIISLYFDIRTTIISSKMCLY